MKRIRRGDIFTVDFEPIRGSEQGKIRPGLILQNDIGNQHSPVVIVASITTEEQAKYDINVEVKSPEGGLTKNSIILLNQIRTVDKSRLGKYWGRLSPTTMKKVDKAIQISLGLVPL